MLHCSSHSHLCYLSAVSSQYFFPMSSCFLGFALPPIPSHSPLYHFLVLLLFIAAAFLIKGQNNWEECWIPLSKPVDWMCWRVSGLQGTGFIGLLAWMELSGSACRVSEHDFLLHSSTAALPLSKWTLKGFCNSVWGVWVRPRFGDGRSRLHYLSEVVSCP